MENKVTRFLVDNILLILAYYVVAHLSVDFLSIPPTHATAIWPPTGISLAAVLLRGYQVLPAVFIADLIIAIEIVGFADYISILFSFMVGFQAMITAWIGSYLIRRFVGVKNQLIDNKAIILFFFLAGPVTMLFPTVFALAVEYYLGMVKSHELLLGGVVWWLGGVLGTFIFAPIALIVLGGKAQRTRIVSIVMPLSIIFVLLVWVFSYTKDHEQQRLSAVFDWRTEVLHRDTIDKVNTLGQELEELKVFVGLFDSVSQQDFSIFSQNVLKNRSDITALAWLPRITSKERDQFEKSLNISIYRGLHGKANNKLNSKKEYFPIKYVESLDNYQALKGLDLSAYKNWNKTLVKAENNAFIVPISFNLKGQVEKLTALVMPVFTRHINKQGNKDLAGYVALLLPFNSVLDGAISMARQQQILLNISGLGIDGTQALGNTQRNVYDMFYSGRINKFGYDLRFIYTPDDKFVMSYAYLPVGWVFMMGLGVSALLCFTLLSVTGQVAMGQKLVDQKTKDLSTERQLLQTVLDSVQEGIVACDERGDLTVFNAAAEKICDQDLSVYSQKLTTDTFVFENFQGKRLLDKGKKPLSELLNTKNLRNFECVFWSGDSPKKVLRVNSRPLLDGHKKAAGVVASFQNITRQKQNIDELKKLSWAVEYSPACILITDKDGCIEYVNSKFVESTGYSIKEITGKNPSFLSAGETDKQKYAQLWQTILSGNEWQGEFLNVNKNGALYWSRQLIAPILNEHQQITHFVAIQEDVTEARKTTERLSYQASHDELTGLLNRRECEKRLDRVIQSVRIQQSKHVFAFLDLDKFKIINDSCGHAAGDYLLQEVCELFKKQLRQRDALTRMGGDEFGIIMEHCSLDQAFTLANKICKTVDDYEFVWEGQSFKIGVSIGLTEIDQYAPGYTQIISQADDACYTAKKEGRGRVSVY